jgi:hypothetical protein
MPGLWLCHIELYGTYLSFCFGLSYHWTIWLLTLWLFDYSPSLLLFCTTTWYQVPPVASTAVRSSTGTGTVYVPCSNYLILVLYDLVKIDKKEKKWASEFSCTCTGVSCLRTVSSRGLAWPWTSYCMTSSRYWAWWPYWQCWFCPSAPPSPSS